MTALKRRTYSLKSYVNIFYTVLLVVLSSLIVLAFYVDLDLNIETVSHRTLEGAVHQSFDSISAPGDYLEVSEDFDYVVEDVHILLYGPEGSLIAGTPPRGFPSNHPLVSDKHRNIRLNDTQWNIYDFNRTYPNGSMIWVRGIYPMNQRINSIKRTFATILWLTPLLILIVSLIGYYLTSRGFRPIQEMIQTAGSIESDQDLSRRIVLPADTSREFLTLATSYNNMLDAVEDAFKREKQFSGDVAHELRTPIAVMISQAEYALTQENAPETQEALESILEQGIRISRMINQLLTLSRHEEGKIPLPDEAVDLSELLEIVMETLEPEAGEKHITIETTIEPNLFVTGDHTELMRLIVNITSNGIKYGREHGHLYVSLNVSEAPQNMSQPSTSNRSWLRLDVEDDGKGISPNELTSIFKRFYQVDPSRKKVQDSSSGLGLTMSLAIAKRHGGTIRVSSVLGEGSIFSIYLPLR